MRACYTTRLVRDVSVCLRLCVYVHTCDESIARFLTECARTSARILCSLFLSSSVSLPFAPVSVSVSLCFSLTEDSKIETRKGEQPTGSHRRYIARPFVHSLARSLGLPDALRLKLNRGSLLPRGPCVSATTNRRRRRSRASPRARRSVRLLVTPGGRAVGKQNRS